jgi:hypothetical protein
MSIDTQKHPSPSIANIARDVRLDFLRGLAILIVVIDHIRDNPVRDFMPVSLGFSDMAEAFLFISGYVCGLSYAPRLATAGFRATQTKALRRCCELYVTNMAALAATILLLRSCGGRWLDALHPADRVRCSEVVLAPGSYLLRIALLGWEPLVFSILPMYIALLFFLPSMLWLMRRHPMRLLIVSLGAYGLVQFFPDTVALREPWRAAWYFNPIAWQLAFVLGVCASSARWSVPEWVSQRAVLIVAATILLEVALVKVILFSPTWLPWADKPSLGPFRLVHFACAVVLIIGIMPAATHPIWSSPWLKPIMTCGRNALAAYAIGGIVSMIARIGLVAAHFDPVAIVAINLGAVSLTLAVASTWQSMKNVARIRMAKGAGSQNAACPAS